MPRKKLTGYECAVAFYDLFFHDKEQLSLRDYLDNSFCDEMGEVDLSVGSHALLYHVESKYITPTRAGGYQSLFEFVRDYLIHPEDRERYVAFMDPKNTLSFLANCEHKNFHFEHLRFKMKDGSYRYVELAAIAGEEYELGPNLFRYYVFDIQNVIGREKGITVGKDDFLSNEVNAAVGLYHQAAFESHAQNAIREAKDREFCLVSLDVEHFKLFDEWYGRDEGDYLIARIGVIIKEFCDQNGGFGGYYGADDFVLITPYQKRAFHALYEKVRATTLSFGYSVGFRPAIGIYRLRNTDNIKDAVDAAISAANRAKKDFKNRIHVYDFKVQEKAEAEYRLLLDFMKALQDDEITFYLQPQCRISTRKIVGVEALARWIKKDGTFVSPAEFIPVLEKYGFITDLDKYMWDKVCRALRAWLDAGHLAVPISINVSRVDILTIDVAAHFEELCKKYSIPHNYLKVEITESAYIEQTAEVADLCKRLREAGFMVLMDDFGSGYSSLNMLSAISVDAIKLDALFLNVTDENVNRSIHIIESIVNMAKIISLPIIVEGVENQSQIDFLQSIGCRYVQGYYFYRPMSRESFEELMREDTLVDGGGFSVKSNEQFRLREFLDENVYSDAMLNNILGPVGVYTVKGDEINIIRYNQQFYQAVNVPDFIDRLSHIERFMPPADVPLLLQTFQEAKQNRLNGATCVAHWYKTDGTLTTFLMNLYYLGDEENGYSRYYGSAHNVTELADLRDQMALIARYITSSVIFLKQRNGDWEFQVIAHGLKDITHIDKDELQKELNDHSFWERFEPEKATALRAEAEKAFAARKGFSTSLEYGEKDGPSTKFRIVADPCFDYAANVDYILMIHAEN